MEQTQGAGPLKSGLAKPAIVAPRGVSASEKTLMNHSDTDVSGVSLPVGGGLQPTDGVREALAVTLRGCDELIPQDDWVKKLAKSEQTGVPLRIKLGLDPTAPRQRPCCPMPFSMRWLSRVAAARN